MGTAIDSAAPVPELRRQPCPGPVLTAVGADQRPRWRPGERLEQLFEERCDATPQRLAVDGPGIAVTFADLDRRANRLARHLLAAGVGPGARVALLFDDPVQAYVGMLGALKAGAAYVPLDRAFPTDRLAFIVADAGVDLVLALRHLRDHLVGVSAAVLCLDEAAPEIDARDDRRPTEQERGSCRGQLAYVIYTSGSTGRPKGVAVEHPSICNFVRVAAEVYGVRPGDRMYQGLTIAFDFSVEEIWVPWIAGATLVPKPAGASLLGADLHEFLTAHRVTAMCCVPTLLATLEEDLPDLRFLLVSGEACPHDLVVRWHRSGRRFLNVYGPTEATVTATWTVVDPGRPVTIGVPLPTYSVVVLDPDDPDRVLSHGEVGELGIGGIGLAVGYVNRDDLTDKAFIPDVVGIPHNPSGRIYRTGDLGRVREDGEIEYLGRIDLQVKIRGYRIELTEIESVMLQVPGVAQAVVDTYAPAPGVKELVAYYSPRSDAAVDEEQLLTHLRERLPPYMVPAYLERLEVIPMTTQQKADRKNLPAPTARRHGGAAPPYAAPVGPTETALAELLAETLGHERVSVASHFFDDLGANSLLMAQFCARVRNHPDLMPVSIRDVYLHPTITALAAAQPASAPTTTSRPSPTAGSAGSAGYVLCGAVQLLMFLASLCIAAGILQMGFSWVTAATTWTEAYLRSVAFGAATFTGYCLLPIVAKWTLVGRWRPTHFRAWSLAYLRFWTIKVLIRANPMALFVGSPLYLLYLRALGARIGPGVVILSRSIPVCTDLLTIGAGTIVREDAFLTCYRAVAGRIETGPVTLGRNVLVGQKTVLEIDTAIGDDGQLGHCSSLQPGQRVPAGQCWHGSPAEPSGVDYRSVTPARCSSLRRCGYSLIQLLNLFLLAPAVFAFTIKLTTIVPWTAGLLAGGRQLGDWHLYLAVLLVSLVLFYSGTLLGLAVIVTVPRLLHRLVRPGGVYPLYGLHYYIHRVIRRLTNSQFYCDMFGDSSYIIHYLKALGYSLADVEQTGSNFGTEIRHHNPYLTTVGHGTMVSDLLTIMNGDYSSTSFTVRPVAIGKRNYLGNGIAYPAQAKVGDNCLLATKVMVPIDGPLRRDVGLLGSPCFEIPRSVQRDSERWLSEAERRRGLAGKNRYNARTIGLFTIVRWFQTFAVLLGITVAAGLYRTLGLWAIAAALLFLVVFRPSYAVLTERLTIRFGSLHPQLCSIYDPYFWWHERLWKMLATPIFNGTPFKNLLWRMLGVKIGRRVLDLGCSIPEKTLVRIGDDSTLNEGSIVQCHSLEDGVFKSDYSSLGAGCTVGTGAWVHYGVTMGDGAVLAADAFLMKGEEVAAGAVWLGNPARETHEPLSLPPTTPAARPLVPLALLAASISIGLPAGLVILSRPPSTPDTSAHARPAIAAPATTSMSPATPELSQPTAPAATSARERSATDTRQHAGARTAAKHTAAETGPAHHASQQRTIPRSTQINPTPIRSSRPPRGDTTPPASAGPPQPASTTPIKPPPPSNETTSASHRAEPTPEESTSEEPVESSALASPEPTPSGEPTSSRETR